MSPSSLNRRQFLAATGTALAGSAIGAPAFARPPRTKMRVALVGTGIRGITMWGRTLARNYGDDVEFVGISDINPGRLEHGKRYIGVDAPTFVDFDEMMRETEPDALIVTTVDSTHHEFIVKGLESGADVITEKPMTTDEAKAQAILDAEAASGKKVTVTFNYRYSPHRARMKELLMAGRIGEVTSVDFHWYLDVYHGADYFRRWHRLTEKGGSLWVHKATHHFDLLNWWLDSDPATVYAMGELEHYGHNGPFRHTNCRPCPHKDQCAFYWDMTQDAFLMDLYADHEHHDGYLRDGCVFKEDVNIYDKMAATIRYANDVHVSYSLTTYSPYEGYRIAFNGTKGRLEAWIKERQPWEAEDYDEIRVTDNFGETELIRIPHGGGGHGGGDARLMDFIFKNPDAPDPLQQAAGSRDGAMSILIGIAARKSCESGLPIQIADLTTLSPHPTRGRVS